MKHRLLYNQTENGYNLATGHLAAPCSILRNRCSASSYLRGVGCPPQVQPCWVWTRRRHGCWLWDSAAGVRTTFHPQTGTAACQQWGFCCNGPLEPVGSKQSNHREGPRLESRRRSEGHLLFPQSLILGHKSWACRWRTAFQRYMKSLYSALARVRYLHNNNNWFSTE